MTRRTRLHAAALGVTLATTVPVLGLLCRGRTPAQYALANLPPWERQRPRPARVRVRFLFPPADPATIRIAGSPALRALLGTDEDALLRPLETPYTDRPRGDAGAGGAWLEAACVLGRGDARLRAKQDRVATRLLNAQGGDGYLGPQAAPGARSRSAAPVPRDWRAHAANMRGLLAYYAVSRNPAAVYAAMGAGDLLTARQWGRPALTPGENAAAVLPLARLSLATAQPQYLALAARLARAGGTDARGLCALYEATGDRAYLDAARRRWAAAPGDAAASAGLLALTGDARCARALARAPASSPWRTAMAFTRAPLGVAVNGSGDAQAAIGSVRLAERTGGAGEKLTVSVARPTSCVVRVLEPGGTPPRVWVNGRAQAPPAARGYLVLRRRWRPGDVVTVDAAPHPARLGSPPSPSRGRGLGEGAASVQGAASSAPTAPFSPGRERGRG